MKRLRSSRRTPSLGVVLGLILASGTTPTVVLGQTRERDVKVTGPRGKTLERHLQSTVTPGGIDRQMTINRPSGTYSREVHTARPPAPILGPGPMARGFPGGFGGPPRNVIVERNVFVNGGRGGVSGAEAFGLGALGAAVGAGAGVLVGRALTPAPPPVMVAQPVVVAPAPMVVGPPPVVVATPPPPAVVYQPASPPPPDAVSEAITRLGSWHESSRKQAAYVLGRLGDPRAIPALVDVLKTDRSAAVRIAAVTAVAQIGDPSSAVYLQRVSIYDKKQEVRDAATVALARMPREVPAQTQTQTQSQSQAGSRPAAPTTRSQPADLEPIESVPPPPAPINPSAGGSRRS